MRDERRDQARLADAGRAREADRVRAARVRVELADELDGRRVAVLDERDRARERARVAGADALDEPLAPSTPRRVMPRARTRCDGSPRRAAAASRRRRADTITTRRDRRTPSARRSAFVIGPATTNASAEHGVVDAHQQREHAAADAVLGAALDERDVRDDRAAVPEPGEHHRGGADPDVRAPRRRRSRRARRSRAAATYASARSRSDQRRRREPAEDEPDAGAGPEQAEAEVARVVRLLGEEHLGDVDRARSRPSRSTRRSARRAARASGARRRSPRPARPSARGRSAGRSAAAAPGIPSTSSAESANVTAFTQ